MKKNKNEITKWLSSVNDKATEKFDQMDKVREYAYATHRELIKISSLSIRATHRKEFNEAKELLKKADDILNVLKEKLGNFSEIYYAGFVHDAQKEVAEANITYALIKGEAAPQPEDINVDYPAYLNGLGEAVGELRRYVLDSIRHKEYNDYEKVMSMMDEIYYLLTSLDYPDAVTKGLRRTTDVTRSIIEKTRGDLTTHFMLKNLSRD